VLGRVRGDYGKPMYFLLDFSLNIKLLYKGSPLSFKIIQKKTTKNLKRYLY
jgi:hypothetical protein